MLEKIYPFLLGLIQGVTEFLPISSSGHLILLPRMLDLRDQGLGVDAILHLATALAIFIYFRQEWWDILVSWRQKNGLFRKIVIASVPAVIVGLLLDGFIENVLRSEWVIVVMLIAIAGLMWWVEKNYAQVKVISTPKTKVQSTVFDVTWGQAILIGLAQVLALIPGTSRSGITILAGMWQNLSREQSAKFSFLLGAPIALGAGLVKSRALDWQNLDEMRFILLAGVVAFLVAMLTMHWLLKFLRTNTLMLFAWYRLCLAVGVILLLLV